MRQIGSQCAARLGDIAQTMGVFRIPIVQLDGKTGQFSQIWPLGTRFADQPATLILPHCYRDFTMIAIAGRPAESYRDRQICLTALAALGSSKYVPLRRLQCRVFGGVVEISGAVSSFYLKQLAQEAVLQLNPSGAIRNLVEVTAEPAALVATSCARPNTRGAT